MSEVEQMMEVKVSSSKKKKKKNKKNKKSGLAEKEEKQEEDYLQQQLQRQSRLPEFSSSLQIRQES
jgi:hypothetical protein